LKSQWGRGVLAYFSVGIPCWEKNNLVTKCNILTGYVTKEHHA